MADEDNGKPKSWRDFNLGELSMEMRLLLAFGLMGLVLFVSQYFSPKPPPKLATQPPVAQSAQAQPEPAPEAAAPVAPAAKPATKKGKAPATPAVPLEIAAAEETNVIDTEFYHILFSNRGACVHSWILKKYKDADGHLVDLVNAAAAPQAGWPFSYMFREEKPKANLNAVLFTVKQTDPLSLEFDYNDGTTSARKNFHFEAKSYRSLLFSEVNDGGKGMPHQLAWRGGFGDRTVHNSFNLQKSVYYDAVKSKLIEEGSGAASKGPVEVSGPFHFAGIEDTFFAAVLLPERGLSINFTTWQDKVPPTPGAEEKEHVGVSFGGKAVNEDVVFVGPKDTNVLRSTDPKLQTMIDWGWFWFIAKPLFLSLHWVNDNLTGNWGWAIVFATTIINLLMLPLRFSQLRSSQKMSRLQPELAVIQAKYKDIPMKDPRKQKQNEEMMGLYQKHGINPLGGCIPLLLQLPFFYAFYKVLSVSIELRAAPWLWVADLSQPETLPIRILPVTMLFTQVGMQKMTPAASPDPSQQKMMMYMMPIMMTFMFYGASSGLVLYWLTGNVVGIVQQYFFNKAAAKPVPAQATTLKKKK